MKKIVFSILFIFFVVNDASASVINWHFTSSFYGIGSYKIYKNSTEPEFQIANDYGNNTWSAIYSDMIAQSLGAKFIPSISFTIGLGPTISSVGVYPTIWNNTNAGYPIQYPTNSYTDPFNIQGDKYVMYGYSWCLYTESSASQNAYFIPWTGGIPCASSYSLGGTNYDNQVYVIPSITPPPDVPEVAPNAPIGLSNGITCVVKNFPDIHNATWHNFGTGFVREDLSNSGSIRLKFSSSTGSITDYDILTYAKGNNFDINPSVIPFDSVPYPGSVSEEAYLRSDGYLNLVSYSGGVQRGFNLIQMNAIGITQGTASVSTYVLKQDGTYSIGSPKTWSGTDLMIGFPESIKQIGLKYLTAFNGIRIGSADNISKTACYTNFNICRWSISGGAELCGPQYAVNGLPLGECSIAGSGSVYGSGSCVPTVDGSGAIIPPNPLAGGYVILDGSGAVVGSVLPPIEEQNQEELDNIFSCGITGDESWYLTLGKAIICPVTVIENLFNSAYTNVTKTINGVNRINSVTSTISLTGSISTNTGSSTGNIIGNTLALKMQDIGKTGKGVHFVGRIYQMGWWALLLGFLIVVVVGTIISIIKNKNGI